MTRIEGQLALLSAGTEERREAVRGEAKAIACGVDWTTLSSLLRARKLLGTLGPRIVALSDTPDPTFIEEVEQAVEAGRRHGSFLQLLTVRLTAMLDEHGIVSAPLKGPQLSEAIYGDPGRRLSSDIDLLVAPERLTTAVEVVRGLGYESPTDFVYGSGLPLLHFALLHPRGELPPVELHWRVHWYEERFAREMLLPPVGEEAPSWRPAPAAELTELLLFYARDGFVDLRLAVDLSAWWDAFGGRLRAGELAELLTSYPELARAVTASLKVSERIVGLPASRILGAAPKLMVRDRLAIRLADPNPTARRAQLHADMGFIDGLLAPTRDLGKFVRRQILLPRGVFRQYARHADFHARSPLDYAVRVLARYGIAGLRALRRSEYV
jgi:Uncharacterised nucleotidyltransferase